VHASAYDVNELSLLQTACDIEADALRPAGQRLPEARPQQARKIDD
jgi:hypothetical protein